MDIWGAGLATSGSWELLGLARKLQRKGGRKSGVAQSSQRGSTSLDGATPLC